jgi:nitrate reductase gamma subunit
VQPLEYWLEVARGPLFAATFLIMLLGLTRHVLLQVSNLILRKGRRLVNVPWNKVLEDTLTWALPFRHLIPGTILFSTVSFLFHIGVIIVPLFLADHVLLWERFLGTSLPAISQSLADYLSLLTIGCLMTLLALRLLMRRLRAMSRRSDYVLLIMVALPFLTGFVSSHPEINPLPWKLTMLLHLLSAETLFLIIPFTKLAHIVLFPFDRISVLHWQLRPGAGDKVAQALYGEEVRI